MHTPYTSQSSELETLEMSEIRLPSTMISSSEVQMRTSYRSLSDSPNRKNVENFFASSMSTAPNSPNPKGGFCIFKCLLPSLPYLLTFVNPFFHSLPSLSPYLYIPPSPPIHNSCGYCSAGNGTSHSHRKMVHGKWLC